MNDVGLISVPLHAALVRPHLMGGAEREPVLMVGMSALGLGVLGGTLVSAIAAGVMLFSGMAILRAMGKADPMMCVAYKRHSALRNYYPALATHWGVQVKVKAGM